MSSITAWDNPDSDDNKPMSFMSSRFSADTQRKQQWIVQGAAYLLAILAHLGAWQIYQEIPPPPVEIPPPIEVTLVAPSIAAPPAAVDPVPAPPQLQPPPPKPQVHPPKPKPLPKVEKPVPKKQDNPTLHPKPAPKPQPEAEAEPPLALYVPPAPPAPPVAHKAPAQPSAGEAEENNRYSTGNVSGYRTNYPALARQRGWEGTVSVKIHVSAEGEIENVSVVGSSGHEILDEYAVDMVRAARNVKPCHRGDKPVACSFTQPIQFRLNRD